MGARLNRVRDMRFEYLRLEQKVEELTALAEKITPVISGMPKAQGKSKTEDIWAKLADYKTMCAQKIEEFIDESEVLEKELSVIKDPRIAAVMKCRYVDCLSIETIAIVMHYDKRTIFRYLDKGKKIYAQYYSEKA